MNSIYERAKEIEKDWKYYSLPIQHLEKFVFTYLSKMSVDEYALRSVFSIEAIQALLKEGEEIINADNRGEVLVTLGSDGMKERNSVASEYEKMFSIWENADWIYIARTADNQIKVQLKLK